MELSEEDLRLINALQISPRLSWSDAGQVLGVHATTLAARWDRLRESGAAWTTSHLTGDPKNMCLAMVDVDCDMDLRPEVTAALAALPEVITVEEAASNRDLTLTVITRDLEQFSAQLLPRLKEIRGLTKYQTALCTRIHISGYAWRLNVLTKGEQQAVRALAGPESASPLGPDASATPLPDSHLALIPFLARDGRVTAAEIARALGRNPATVQRQLGRVLASRMLSFRCEIAQQFSGYPVTIQWFANVPPGRHEAAAVESRAIRNVRFAASTTGRTNFTIIMWLRSLAEVLEMELTVQQRIPGIELVESVVMLNTAKRVGWMLNPDSTATGEVVAPYAEFLPDGI
ncbi:Lrp/AsnC family transcriptional regulator [Paenarthrobacter nicotinovorans]|uniref:Lrp/AsnC family transcriptional regulator n=1 Tax=Paenarthrobacter nicotinovorans TaxID=29320 RepID=A0ABV0GSS2_PAENI|nr:MULTISPECIES: Lrp/AsnC family transcriptional regulator [Micrococcaceae]